MEPLADTDVEMTVEDENYFPEVSKTDLSLEEYIAGGLVEEPALMEFNDWQKWRRDTGTRPTKKDDGRATTPAQEAALWKSTMLRLYGDSWNIQLALERQTLEESSGRAEAEEAERSGQRGVAPHLVPSGLLLWIGRLAPDQVMKRTMRQGQDLDLNHRVGTVLTQVLRIL